MILKIEVLHTTDASFQMSSSAAWCGGRPWDLKAQVLDSETAKTAQAMIFPKRNGL